MFRIGPQILQDSIWIHGVSFFIAFLHAKNHGRKHPWLKRSMSKIAVKNKGIIELYYTVLFITTK